MISSLRSRIIRPNNFNIIIHNRHDNSQKRPLCSDIILLGFSSSFILGDLVGSESKNTSNNIRYFLCSSLLTLSFGDILINGHFFVPFMTSSIILAHLIGNEHNRN